MSNYKNAVVGPRLFAIVDPNWGDPQIIPVTIRKSTTEAINVAINMPSLALWSGMNLGIGLQQNKPGDWQRLLNQGFECVEIEMSIVKDDLDEDGEDEMDLDVAYASEQDEEESEPEKEEDEPDWKDDLKGVPEEVVDFIKGLCDAGARITVIKDGLDDQKLLAAKPVYGGGAGGAGFVSAPNPHVQAELRNPPYDAVLRNWKMDITGCAVGEIYSDGKGRFEDGQVVRTSQMVSITEGAFGKILQTRNTKYKLVNQIG